MVSSVLPEIKIVAIDVTQHWNLADMPEVRKIWDLYVTDASTRSYLCEITPSYYLAPVGEYIIEWTPDFESCLCLEDFEEPTGCHDRKEEIENLIRKHDSAEAIYLHCTKFKDSDTVKICTFALSEENLKEFNGGNLGVDVIIDGVIEYLHENAAWFDDNGKLKV